jgi:2-isopropylmalate synthase
MRSNTLTDEDLQALETLNGTQPKVNLDALTAQAERQ